MDDKGNRKTITLEVRTLLWVALLLTIIALTMIYKSYQADAAVTARKAAVQNLVGASYLADPTLPKASLLPEALMADASFLEAPTYPQAIEVAGWAPTTGDVDSEITCLALNIYHEARGEPNGGQVAVAHVVMNRVADRRFPNSVCEVVRQGGEVTKNRCQFSWWCDGRKDRPHDGRSWQITEDIARSVYWGRSEDPTKGALWYHADSVSPYWSRAFQKGPTIGRHIFYRGRETPIQVASNSWSRGLTGRPH